MLKRFTAAVLLGAMVGCTAVRPVAAPASFIPEEQPEQVWVASEEGETFALLRPQIRGDSVTGILAGTNEPITVPLDSSHRVFAKQNSPSKTAQLVGSMGLLAGLTVLGFAIGESGPKVCSQPGMRGCPPQ
jgi:hypothetical protein